VQTQWFAAVPTLAACIILSSLPASSEFALLPDPFIRWDGTRVVSHTEWPARRAEMISQLEAMQYGKAPPLPARITVEDVAREQRVFDASGVEATLVTATLVFDGVRMRVGYWLPADVEEPAPVLLACEPVWWENPFITSGIAERVVARGFVFAGFWMNDLASFEDPSHRPVQDAHPDYDWGTVAVGAWGFRVTMNWLETVSELDTQRVCIWGHSRRGKATAWATALDERFAAAIPHMSGMGGTAVYRVSSDGGQRLEQLLERFWLHPRVFEYIGREHELPFDQHWLHALVAPRPMYAHAGVDDTWGNPRGEQAAWLAGRQVYAWLGAAGHLGIHFGEYGHHDPGQPEGADSWEVALQFMEWHFLGKTPAAAFHSPRFPDMPLPFDWEAPSPKPSP